MSENERVIVQTIGKVFKKRLDGLRDDFEQKAELLGRGIVKVRDDFQGLAANATSNDSEQAGLENLRKEMLMGMITLRDELLNEISKAKDECRRMLVETVTTTALQLRPKRSLTITHSDGTESVVSEHGEEE